jgi:hypothetical protein
MNAQQQEYYAKLYKKCRGRYSRRTIQEALFWLDKNYTGDTRAAFRHQMDAPSWQTTVELKLRSVFKSIIKRGN